MIIISSWRFTPGKSVGILSRFLHPSQGTRGAPLIHRSEEEVDIMLANRDRRSISGYIVHVALAHVEMHKDMQTRLTEKRKDDKEGF